MIMNGILTLSTIIFPLITFPYATRILLPVGTGRVSFVTSIIAYFSMFAQLGIPTYGIRACAKVRDDKEKLSKTVHELLITNFVMVILAYIAFGISLAAIPRFNQEKELFFIMCITILLNALGVEWLYKALEEYTYITLRSIIFKVIGIIAMFALIHNQDDYIIYGGVTIFATSASNILNFINLRKKIILKPLGGYAFKKHIKPMLTFFFMSVATTIYTNLDSVMLGFMKGDAEVGIYTAAVKIRIILTSIVTSASVVLLPRASQYVEKGMMDDFYRILKKTMHFILLTAIPMSLFFGLYAKESILLLSGKEYIDAVLPMQIIMPTLILIGISNLTGIQMMIPLGMEKQVLISEIAGAIVDLILNFILIPDYGVAGAAIGTLIAEFVVLYIQLFSIRDKLVELFSQIPLLKIVLTGLIASLTILIGWQLNLGIFMTLLIGATMFFGVYIAALFITKDMLILELSRQLLNKLKK